MQHEEPLEAVSLKEKKIGINASEYLNVDLIKPECMKIFKQILERHLKCVVCSGIIFDPVSCSTCQEIYCKSCLKDLIKKNKSCLYEDCFPIYISERLNDVSIKKFERIKLFCIFKCNAELNLLNYPRHISKCENREITCTFCQVGKINEKQLKDILESMDNKERENEKLKEDLVKLINEKENLDKTLRDKNELIQKYEHQLLQKQELVKSLNEKDEIIAKMEKDLKIHKIDRELKMKIDEEKGNQDIPLENKGVVDCSEEENPTIEILKEATTTLTTMETNFSSSVSKEEDEFKEMVQRKLHTNPTSLDLGSSIQGNKLTFYLSKCDFLEKIEKLNLSGNLINNEGIKPLIDCNFPNLKNIDLSENKIGPDGIENLAKCTFVSNLEGIDLSSNDFSNEAMKRLAKCDFKNLTSLELSGNKISNEGIEHLTRCLSLNKLNILDLSDNKIEREGIEQFSKCEHLSNLECLDLGSNKVGKEGVKNLSKCEFLQNLISLDLSDNDIGNEGLDHLSSCSFLKNLTSLDLWSNDINSEGLEFLSKCTFLGSLSSLDLASNDINGGLEFLSSCDFLQNLTSLGLGDNDIRDDSIEHLVNSHFFKNLTNLDLASNDIAKEQLEILSKEFPNLAINC